MNNNDRIVRFIEMLRDGNPRAWIALGLLAALLVVWIVRVNKEAREK